jgi:hypothetical protein
VQTKCAYYCKPTNYQTQSQIASRFSVQQLLHKQIVDVERRVTPENRLDILP